jgi:hypothetical protein
MAQVAPQKKKGRKTGKTGNNGRLECKAKLTDIINT